ncbi:MAG: hypothetical protein II458_06990 [Oscillospiraceae bacterium]|nr:hypothetical protein [Oscillospiraceae bacterium]
MSKYTDDELYQLLTETGRLLQGVKPQEGEEYSLDAILAEYGQETAKPAPKSAEPPADQPEEPEPSPASAEQEEKPEKPVEDPALLDTGRLRSTVAANMARVMGPEKKMDGSPVIPGRKEKPAEKPALHVVEGGKSDTAKELPSDIFPEEPEGMHKVPLEQVMSQTVESVLDEDDAILDTAPPLLERVQDALEDWGDKLNALLAKHRKGEKPSRLDEAEDEPETVREEPEMEQAARDEKRLCKKLHRCVILSAVPTLLLAGVTVADAAGVLSSLWDKAFWLHNAVLGGLLLVTALLTFHVWRETVQRLRNGRSGCELAACAAVLVTLADCAYGALHQGGTYAPFAAPAAVMIWLCQLGQLLRADIRWSAFHLADIGGTPPYGAGVTAAGTCKQKGTIKGFYNTAFREAPPRRWQNVLVPLYLAAATVLSAVVALSRKDSAGFLWVWSALLAAGIPLSLPLTDTLPMKYLIRRLVKSGSAVAGYEGARTVCGSRRMVVTDDDLFPPGTVGLNGLKVYGEEIGKVVSYAASMAQACHSQLTPLFDQLLLAEGGLHLTVEDLHYFEEGGVGGTIHGESVTMGSAYFMRKSHVTLPQELKLKTGVFLAVDGTLIAIFAIKYQPSRNVEWALRAMRRNRIVPVLAVRSCNVTPGLVKRKFNLDARALYPDVSTRLALSDLSRETVEQSGAIIYREGLMPFAETAVGSRRMIRASRWASVLAYLGGLCGLLLAYYFTGVGAPELLDPLRMLVFQGLWLLPTLLLDGMVKHY